MFPLRGGKAFIPAFAPQGGIGREADIGPLLLAMKNLKNHTVFFILSERRMMRHPTIINITGYLIKKPTRADRQIKKSTNSSVLFIVIYSDARHVF